MRPRLVEMSDAGDYELRRVSGILLTREIERRLDEVLGITVADAIKGLSSRRSAGRPKRRR